MSSKENDDIMNNTDTSLEDQGTINGFPNRKCIHKCASGP